MEYATKKGKNGLQLLATNTVDFKQMMMINSKDKKLVVASLDEQKKRNVIDRPLVEHWESDDSE